MKKLGVTFLVSAEVIERGGLAAEEFVWKRMLKDAARVSLLPADVIRQVAERSTEWRDAVNSWECRMSRHEPEARPLFDKARQ